MYQVMGEGHPCGGFHEPGSAVCVCPSEIPTHPARDGPGLCLPRLMVRTLELIEMANCLSESAKVAFSFGKL